MKSIVTTSILLIAAGSAAATATASEADADVARRYLNAYDQIVLETQMLAGRNERVKLQRDIAESMQSIAKAGYKLGESGELVPLEQSAQAALTVESLDLPHVISAPMGGMSFGDNAALPTMETISAPAAMPAAPTSGSTSRLPTLQHVNGEIAYFITETGVIEAKNGSKLPGGFVVASVTVDGVKVQDNEGVVRVLTIPWGSKTVNASQSR